MRTRGSSSREQCHGEHDWPKPDIALTAWMARCCVQIDDELLQIV